MQVPIGIGSRAGSLEHKLRALLFAFCLERPVANIPVALSSVMSMTTDLGTESGMMVYRTESWQSLMPTWMGLASGLVDDCGAESFQHDGSASLFPQGFVVPGMLHIINNMTLDIDSALEHWATWLEGLRCLVGLLAVRHNGERFIGTCVNGTRHAHLAAAFKCNLPNIVDWRWSIITKVLEPLLKLRWPLVATWSEESFLHSASVAEARGPIAPPGQAGVPQPPQHSAGNKELNAQRLTRVIHNKWWWAFCKMLFTIHQVADQLGSWAESCPCHQFDIETHEVIHTVCRQARMPVGCDGQHADCRMRGRRAFELATGQLTVFFEKLWGVRFQDLLLQHSCELPAEDFDALVKDLGNAKSYMTQILIQKCAFWERLPWKLCGLASPNPHAAREVATAALAQFDASPHVRDLPHPVAWRFLSKDGELRECVQKLAAGVPLAELAPLRFEVAALAFTPVVERVIERQHATVHKQISARTAGGAYVSCSLRLPETTAHPNEPKELYCIPWLSAICAAFA